MSENSNERRFSSDTEKAIFLASSAIALSICEGKTATEIELISILLENISFQMTVLTDIRLINDGLADDLIFPIL